MWFIEAFIATCVLFVAHAFPLNKYVEKTIIERKWYGYPAAFAYYFVWSSIAVVLGRALLFSCSSTVPGSR